MSKIVFVCTGNTCRSPMAQGLFLKLLRERGVTDVEVVSAGTSAADGLPASEHAIAAATELGADISGHRSRQVSHELLDRADAIFCMTDGHAEIVSALAPAEKIFTLPGGVPDPYGGDLNAYRACAAAILDKLRPIAEQVL